MKAIYMDYAATTPVHEEVIETMTKAYKSLFGNPSSIHSYGREARKYVDQARRSISRNIGADEREIIFTSGGTEANNLAIIGTALAYKGKGNHIITTEIEHHAVLRAVEFLERNGFQVTYLPVDKKGRISIQDLENAIKDETILVSVMYVNNETGVLQPIKEISELIKEKDIIFHTDAVQAMGTLPINVETLSVDLLTASAHKINGPKGIGFLYVREGVHLESQLFGGEQERKRRAGTENVTHILGFEKAMELATVEQNDRNKTYAHLKHTFLDELKNKGVSFEINGDETFIVPTIVNISFPNINVETMLTNLDLEGVAASSGSACTAGSVEPSHVLVSMFGEEDERTVNSIRFSFGMNQTEEMMKEAAGKISKIVQRLTK